MMSKIKVNQKDRALPRLTKRIKLGKGSFNNCETKIKETPAKFVTSLRVPFAVAKVSSEIDAETALAMSGEYGARSPMNFV